MEHDPSRVLLRYRQVQDMEVAAFIAAMLAFGRRALFLPKVDFLLEHNGCLYPMEVKLSSRPMPGDLKGARHIPTGINRMHPGVVLCTATSFEKLNADGMCGFPISAL